MKRFEILAPKTVDQAVSQLKKYGPRSNVIAGGTDLLSMMKDRLEGPGLPIPEVLIDIQGLSGLNSIKYESGRGLRIGALTTLSRIEAHPAIREKFGILAQATAEVASPQLRNVGTIGGNMCQRPRCWYFRNRSFNCYKKGGDSCFGVTGDNRYYHAILEGGPCYMVHPSDMAPPLIALGARVKIVGPRGPRVLPIEELFIKSSRDILKENVLKPDELLTEVHIPDVPPNTEGCYLKSRIRRSWDFALAGVAVVTTLKDGVCEDCKIALGGVAPIPLRVVKAEETLKGKKIDEGLALQAAHTAVMGARALSMNAYKVDMARALAKRAILATSLRG